MSALLNIQNKLLTEVRKSTHFTINNSSFDHWSGDPVASGNLPYATIHFDESMRSRATTFADVRQYESSAVFRVRIYSGKGSNNSVSERLHTLAQSVMDNVEDKPSDLGSDVFDVWCSELSHDINMQGDADYGVAEIQVTVEYSEST